MSRKAPLIISFYTLNTPYEQEAQRLIDSCKKWNLEFCIEGLPSQGSWEKNCAVKPFYILEKMREHARPLFWVDADAAFLRSPDFSPFLDYDLGVRTLDFLSEDHTSRVLSGSLFINATPAAQNLIENWCAECARQQENHKRTHEFWDQVALRDVIARSTELRVAPLPVSYCKIFDVDLFFIGDEEVVIEHYQASRRLKCHIT